MKLVLLPGLDGTGVLFRPFIAVLPPSIEPVVVSYPTRQPLGYDELLSIVRDALLQNEPFVLLGESFGGPLSLRIAAERPPGLRGLILAGSFVSCPFVFVPQWAAALVRFLPFRSFPYIAKIKSRLGLYETPEHFALSLEALTMVSAEVFAHRIREIIRADVTSELKACNVPILYLQGEHDYVVPSANLRRILHIKPTVQSVIISSAHMILKTRPRDALKAILDFIARVEGQIISNE